MIATATRTVTILDDDGQPIAQVHVKRGHRYNTGHPYGKWMAEHCPDLFDLGDGDPAEPPAG